MLFDVLTMHKVSWYFLSFKSFYEGYLARTKVDAYNLTMSHTHGFGRCNNLSCY